MKLAPLSINNLIKRIREWKNIFIYDSQHQVLSILKYLTFIISVFSFSILIYYHGFPLDILTKNLIINIIKGLFLIYIINYLMRLFYAFDNVDFLKENWLEGLLIGLLVADIICLYFANFPLLEWISARIGIANFRSFYILFIQVFIMLLVGIQLLKISSRVLAVQIKPATLFMSFFLIVIALGTVLLMLPEMTTSHENFPFIDALFTAASASCVTGLTVVDTATFFTFKGHVVILLLIQIGAVGIMIFASFFAFFLKKGLGIRHQTAMQDYLNDHSVFNSVKLVKQILFYTVFIELIATAILFLLWDPVVRFDDLGEKLFYSFFHAVSGFCNSGFTLFTDGLNNPMLKNAYLLHMLFIGMIFLGALGFPAWRDLFGIKNLRLRMRLPWKQWKTSTSVALYAAVLLLVMGSLAFFFLERNNTLKELNLFESIVTSIFQSVTRTGGFSTVNIGELADPTYIILIFLMFVGGASGSMAGGLKTSTFIVILLSVIATIKGKKGMEISRKSISNELLYRAFAVAMFITVFILAGGFLLAITEPEIDTMQLIFEEVSAVSLSGLSTGITPYLSLYGKLILIVSMYFGRIGSLTLAFSLSSPVVTSQYKYPDVQVIVG